MPDKLRLLLLVSCAFSANAMEWIPGSKYNYSFHSNFHELNNHNVSNDLFTQVDCNKHSVSLTFKNGYIIDFHYRKDEIQAKGLFPAKGSWAEKIPLYFFGYQFGEIGGLVSAEDPIGSINILFESSRISLGIPIINGLRG